jgi:hypothetical protein
MNIEEKLFRSLYPGNIVSGTYEGEHYTGVITQMEDIRKPRGEGVKGYIYHIKLNSPIIVFGVIRTTIRLKRFVDENNDNSIKISNPSMVGKKSNPPKDIDYQRGFDDGVREFTDNYNYPNEEIYYPSWDRIDYFGKKTWGDNYIAWIRTNYRTGFKAGFKTAANKIKTKVVTSRDTRKGNPGNLSSAIEMNESFHGRPTEYIDEQVISTKYEKDLAQLGWLTEIEILCGEDSVCPIEFRNVKLCCYGKGTQLFLIGGNQSLPLNDLGITQNGKQFYDIGECHTISYRADKHHLEDSNGKVAEYIHEFGEDNGVKPTMVYDSLNKTIQLVGGSYHVEDRGIVN